VNAIRWLLGKENIALCDVDILACNISLTPGFEESLRRFLSLEFGCLPKRIEFYHHHLSHAACAFWGSGVPDAAILTYDYSGDGVCTGLHVGGASGIAELEMRRTRDDQSLGKMYAAFTQYLGFGRGDEYKLMGLSAYGDRNDLLDLSGVIEVGRDDYRIDGRIFNSNPMTSLQQHVFNAERLRELGLPARLMNEPITAVHKRLAISVQVAFEQATLAMARRLKDSTGARRLVVAGGCALNCVAMSRIRQSGLFEEVLIPAAASDAGSALGAAYLAGHHLGVKCEPVLEAGLGPEFSADVIAHWLDVLQVRSVRVDDLAATAAKDIASNLLVGWYQGRSEFGPRALGHRSILANPADTEMRDKINKRVKFRETFRPFAPAVQEQEANRYFVDACPSPFMAMVFDVKNPEIMPAVTHVDGTARVQTVNSSTGDAAFYELLGEVKKYTGSAIVLNTSFNINGQPIVNTPHEAIYTFFSSGLDVLYIGPFRVAKN
jgi:carbamoyltransferase